MKTILFLLCLLSLASCVRVTDPREYQIELNEDASITIYDGLRLVGTIEYDSTNTVCEMFINDNL